MEGHMGPLVQGQQPTTHEQNTTCPLVLQIKFYSNTATLRICLRTVCGCFWAATAKASYCDRDHTVPRT